MIPLPWHLQAWNSGTCLFMMWTAAGSLNLFINSIVWHQNAIDWAPVWCDISTRIIVGVSVGIPASSLCINRRLYKIASCQTASITRAQKKRAVMVDLAIGLGIPFLQMPLQFIVQGHRYDIWEDIGCFPTTVNTPPAYPLTFLWPNIISLVSAVYCVMTLHVFMKRRAQFSQFVSSVNSSLTINRYFRLMLLATSELLFNIPISTYGLYLNITNIPVYPWKSWSDIHFDWYTPDIFPALLWRSNRSEVATLELSRWTLVFCALLFFGFFGFADEARKNYRLAYWTCLKRFGIAPPSKTSSISNVHFGFSPMKNSTAGKLPVFISPPLPPHNSCVLPAARNSFSKSDYSASTHQSSTLPVYKVEWPVPATPASTTSSQSSHSLPYVPHDIKSSQPST